MIFPLTVLEVVANAEPDELDEGGGCCFGGRAGVLLDLFPLVIDGTVEHFSFGLQLFSHDSVLFWELAYHDTLFSPEMIAVTENDSRLKMTLKR